MAYSDVAELVTYYGEFKEIHPEGDHAAFGRWLMSKSKTPFDENEPSVSEESKEFAEYIRERTPSQQLGILIGRLFRFAKFYAKKNLSDLNLSLEEFGFLAGTKQMGNPTKSELIYMNLTEPTSGTEILKRLIKLGFVIETENNDDKRSKRISVTDLGMKTLIEAYQRMGNMAYFMAGNLTHEEVDQLVGTLRYLNDFHTYHYHHNKEMNVDELIAGFIEKK